MLDDAIRPAHPEDAQAIADVQIRTWRVAYRGHVPDSVLDDFKLDQQSQSWAAWFDDDSRRLWVAEPKKAIIGLVGVGPVRDESFDADTGEIDALYVLPEHWRQSWGSVLLRPAMKNLASRFERIVLWALSGNERARAFYRDRGFRTPGETKYHTFRGSTLELEQFRHDLEG